MTEKLKCPFCGAELQTDNEIARLIMWRCHTPGCLLNGWHSVEIIQHLIDGKKAQDALKEIVNFFDTECEKDDLYFYNLIDDNIAKYREITSITKQEE